MSSLENGTAHARRLKRGCTHKARIKPRQACNCRTEHRQRQMSETGGIYDA